MENKTQDEALSSAVVFTELLCLSFAELKHHLSSLRTLREMLSYTGLDKTCKN